MTQYAPPESLSPHAKFKVYGWMQTYTGRKFSLADPQPEDVDIIDIAVGLGRTVRFNGHTSRPYTVAQHCVLVSHVCHQWPLLGLMHDAAEAYTGDVVRPMKLGLGPRMAEIESKIYAVICRRFGLMDYLPDEVHEADHRMLATEQRDLMRHQLEWGCLKTAAGPYDSLKIEPWDSSLAIKTFMARFAVLASYDIDWSQVPTA